MPKFNYVAMDSRGKETKGTLEVANQNEAIGRIKEMGFFPTKVVEDKGAPATGAAKKAVKDLLTGKEKGLEKLIAGAPVTFFGPASPGAYQQETITAKPGWYVQVCFMETQDGRSHSRLGMERIIKIVK